MYGYICVKNFSSYPAISVYINDRLYFPDLLTESAYKQVSYGSAQVIVLNNRNKIIFDIYLPVHSKWRYVLEIYQNSYNFIPVGFS